MLSTSVVSVQWLTAIALVLLVIFLSYRVLRPGRLETPVRILTTLLLSGAAATAPFLLPLNQVLARGIVTVLAILLSAKLVQYSKGQLSDPTLPTRFRRFLLWVVIATDIRWLSSEAERSAARRAGVRRLAFALPHAAIAAAIYWALLTQPWILQTPFVGSFAIALFFYVAGVLTTDIILAQLQLFGLRVREMFRWPILARSPSDFWSRRWNLLVTRFAAANIFYPLGGPRRAVLATLAVFLASGVMHEYVVIGTFGIAQARLGYMTAFFLLQGLAVATHRRLARKMGRLRTPIAIALQLSWMTLTAPLFFEPLTGVLPVLGLPESINLWPLP